MHVCKRRRRRRSRRRRRRRRSTATAARILRIKKSDTVDGKKQQSHTNLTCFVSTAFSDSNDDVDDVDVDDVVVQFGSRRRHTHHVAR